MNFLNELRNFIKNILNWILVFLATSFIFFAFPTQKSLSVMLFEKIKLDLLPDGVTLIVTNPMSAFLSEMIISIFLAFIFVLPFFLYGLIKYLSPALHKHENQALYLLILPSSLLFALGCIFSYFYIIPPTFKILYNFTADLGATPFFTVGDFVSTVLGILLATGVMFLLPVVMSLLSFIGLAKRQFWRENWRFAFLFFIILSAIITPDGTGITMMILSTPLVGLYGLGIVASRK